MSGNQLYDEISEKIKNSVDVDYDLISSIIHLDKQYLENIYSILLCSFIEQCYSAGYQIDDILNSLRVGIPFNGKILSVFTGRGLSYKISEFPPKFLVMITYYLKNYFKWEK